MSISDYKKPPHRRNDSGELDVFEAANYFSGYNDNHNNNYYLMPQKVVSKEEKRGYLREGRVSLDVPSLKHYYIHSSMVEHQQQHQQQQQQQKSKDKKKYKQPSSPGGKIAQFLNSLFSQTNSKNNNKKSSSSKSLSLKDEDVSPVSRRKRSSISHFRSTSSAIDARSMYSTSSSGFRTPPPYNLNRNTPSTKSCKDSFRSFSDYKDVLSTLSKYKIQGNGNINNSINGISKDNYDINKVVKGSSNNNLDWIDEKLRMVEKSKNYNNHHQEKNLKKENYNKKYNQHQHEDPDDGADSDSSSDLFELRIDYDFGFCSSGLPVYETTHMDNIKRASSTTITSVPIKT